LEVSGQLHAPAALLAGKEAVASIGKEAGWAPMPFCNKLYRQYEKKREKLNII
jgi:hypothetical protein